MFKFLIIFLIGVSCFASCPDLSLKGTPLSENISNSIMQIYEDTLKAYHQTEDIKDYLSKENLVKLAETQIWGLLSFSLYFPEHSKKN